MMKHTLDEEHPLLVNIGMKDRENIMHFYIREVWWEEIPWMIPILTAIKARPVIGVEGCFYSGNLLAVRNLEDNGFIKLCY
ncbi:hypothetical protein J7E71_19055 [Mesobacillus foraminis]|uniref:hypothetical protein n=1 Tax=Mesobacillus foraminis TaxID=279826 RepID=UPI001BEA278B|nr:hypothetical protein [Mesobacillus foraminis]MBT2757973.1 hypothetical protein [Mesobacillus foraminis]